MENQIALKFIPLKLPWCAAVLMGLLLLTACHRRKTPEGTTPISLMTFEWGTGRYNYNYRRDIFNKQSDGVHLSIIHVPYTTYATKLMASVAGNIAPDVFYSPTGRHRMFIEAGAFMSLDQFINGPNGIDLGDFKQDLIKNQMMKDGKIHALPQAMDCLALYYNKDLFNKAGIPLLSETEPITWDRYREIAVTLTRDLNDDGYIDQYGCMPGFDSIQPSFFLYTFHASYGGKAYNDEGTRALFDRKESIEAMQYLHGLIYQYKCAPPPHVGQQIANQLFPANRLGMFINGPWTSYDYHQTAPDLNYGVAPLPYRPGYPITNYVGGPAVGISANCKNPEAAWKVVKFLLSPEFQKLPIQGLPSRLSVMESPEFSPFPYYEIFERQLEHGTTNFFIPEYDTATSLIRQFCEPVLSDPEGLPKIQGAMQDLNNALNSMLADD